MWNVTPSSGRWDWENLKREVNNMVCATPCCLLRCQRIYFTDLRKHECFEPYTSTLLTQTLSGEFIIANKFLMRDLMGLGLWNDAMRQKLIRANGSVQDIPEIPQNIKDLYKTVWEISQRRFRYVG